MLTVILLYGLTSCLTLKYLQAYVISMKEQKLKYSNTSETLILCIGEILVGEGEM